ncbi:TonB-dependent receptor [uncultured Algibacter sp.]|uniref:SusC/RagA family TonB-linked outer membrane protein n=1 Tax=uncultured Algibacter sp. TaxID=298659 RepID=UPI003217216E
MKKLKQLERRDNGLKPVDFALNKLIKKALLATFCFSVGFTQVNAVNANTGKIADYDTEAKNPILNNKNMNSKEQQTVITGVVSDADGPLPGVNIVAKGTSAGAQTDFDGTYSITLKEGVTTLVFSYVGYKTQDVEVSNKTTINIVLEQDIAGLDEVVVVGYTTKTRGELTGAVATIGGADIQQGSSKDITKSLAGRAPGLVVVDRGGFPGANGNGARQIFVRGRSTTGNNSALILIDGIVSGEAELSRLSPDDIASLSVLKDGTAAIYGARAANGVILVTTKRGRTGKPKVSITTEYNTSSLAAPVRLINGRQFATYQNEIIERTGGTPQFTQQQINAIGTNPFTSPDTDWFDETIANSSPETRHRISISGGSEYIKYHVSADSYNQQSLFRSGDVNFKQDQFRTNFDIKVTDNFKVGVDVSGQFSDRNTPGIPSSLIFQSIYQSFPTDVAVFPNGLPGPGTLEFGQNPVLLSSNQTGFVNQDGSNLRGRFSIDWELDKLVEGLSVNAYAGLRKINTHTKDWYTPWTYYIFDEVNNDFIPQTGRGREGPERTLTERLEQNDNLLLNATLRYNRTIKDNHSINAFVGVERQKDRSNNFEARKVGGFPSATLPELFAGSNDGVSATGASAEINRISAFGSLSYDFKKKYFLDLTVRRDGSDNFGPGNRFGTFPSISGAWAISKEKFLENVSWLDELKISGSWAKLGNDRIGRFQFTERFRLGPTVNNNGIPNFSEPIANTFVQGTGSGQLLFGLTQGTEPNPGVTWESSEMLNIGLNFTLFDRRLSGEVNYFTETRDNILVQAAGNTPLFLGLSAGGNDLPSENIGIVENKGFDFQLSWNDQIGNVAYNIGGNFTLARSKIIEGIDPSGLLESLKQQGNPLGAPLFFPTNGLLTSQEQVDAQNQLIADNTPTGPPAFVSQEGDIRYIDTNDDGVLNNDDRVRADLSNVPEIQFGLAGGAQWKNFGVNFLFQGQARARTLVFFNSVVKPQHLFDGRWTPDNTGAQFPRAFGDINQQSSDINTSLGDTTNGQNYAQTWLMDAAFVRLKELELSYTLKNEKSKLGADIKLFARGFNLFTFFSDIDDLGLDPEVASYNGFAGSNYGTLKTYTIGANISF